MATVHCREHNYLIIVSTGNCAHIAGKKANLENNHNREPNGQYSI